MLALSETFGRSDTPSKLDHIPGYKMWSTERGGAEKGGGGLTMIYDQHISAHQWTHPVPAEQYVMNERQWLLLCFPSHLYSDVDSPPLYLRVEQRGLPANAP